ncbi:MAG: class I SAM-dependent methyltransferase [Acidimicrobiales bacterium]
MRLTGCDLSPAMLAVARTKDPPRDAAPIELVESPAAPPHVETGAYDVALCQHGLQFFPDRPAALAEMRRAVTDGGRLGLAVWTSIDESPCFAALRGALADVLGETTADRYKGGPWGLPKRTELVGLVEAAGFENVRC